MSGNDACSSREIEVQVNEKEEHYLLMSPCRLLDIRISSKNHPKKTVCKYQCILVKKKTKEFFGCQIQSNTTLIEKEIKKSEDFIPLNSLLAINARSFASFLSDS